MLIGSELQILPNTFKYSKSKANAQNTRDNSVLLQSEYALYLAVRRWTEASTIFSLTVAFVTYPCFISRPR